MDGPNASCYPCSQREHDRCAGYTYPLATYRCACNVCDLAAEARS